MKARFAIALAAWPMLLQAQDASSVRASLEPQRIRIGEHAVISITAPADDPTVQWPTIADTLNAHIEVIGTAELDTAASGQGASMLVRRITITSFDTGYWAIPPFQLKAGGKSLETEPLLLQVDGFPVDAASVPADIKPIHRLPFSPLWWAMQHWTWIAGALATALLVALIVFLVRRTREPAQEAIPQEARVELHQRVLAQRDASHAHTGSHQQVAAQIAGGAHTGHHSRQGAALGETAERAVAPSRVQDEEQQCDRTGE